MRRPNADEQVRFARNCSLVVCARCAWSYNVYGLVVLRQSSRLGVRM
jgi:hypothetical protein